MPEKKENIDSVKDFINELPEVPSEKKETKKKEVKKKRAKIKDAPSIWANPDHRKDSDGMIRDQCIQVQKYALDGEDKEAIARYMGLDVDKHPAFTEYKMPSGKVKKYYEAGRFQYDHMIKKQIKKQILDDENVNVLLKTAAVRLIDHYNQKVQEERALREENSKVQRIMIVNPIEDDES